ncbi:thioredoxin family protein [Fictibacillus iocasae]|uniref:Thioredoxin family protein n=1 Tax=Fictibacillus iocasae TaxID=2715437 RepID=A0ABW2NNZ0_9BACL
MILQLTKERYKEAAQESISKPIFIYFETPLCGTCKMGKRMLEIAVQTAANNTPNLSIYQCNINEFPDLARAYAITSVPCLTVLRRGVATKQVYAMQSAGHLYSILLSESAK